MYEVGEKVRIIRDIGLEQNSASHHIPIGTEGTITSVTSGVNTPYPYEFNRDVMVGEGEIELVKKITQSVLLASYAID